VSWAAERNGKPDGRWLQSFALAKNAATEALRALAEECLGENAFNPKGIELDDYTALRNTVSIGAWATLCLVNESEPTLTRCVQVIEPF
jgi:hypothetical protein